ncbi:MAG: hypothetical protein U0528_10800 [Anaerolineae bacterium]
MRGIAIISALILALTFAMLTVARGIGAAYPQLTPFLSQFEQDSHLDKPNEQWCWRGLCPGQQAPRQAENILADYGAGAVYRQFATVYWHSGTARPTGISDILVNFADDTVLYVQIKPSPRQFTLGDALMQFGSPRAITLERDLKNWVIFNCFDEGVCTGMISNTLRPNPYLPLTVISFQKNSTARDLDRRVPNRYRWHGFSRLWIR